MKIIYLFLGLNLCLFLPSFGQNINTAKLDSFFNALDQNKRVMGSFAVAKDGKTVYTRSVGYSLKTPADSTLATATTKYRIGSISKVFTATMVFQLIDEGKLSLDTKLNKYFPKLPNAERITIGQLLTHSSGLMDYVNDVADKNWITKPHSRAELLDTIARRKVHFEPGAKQQYSNSGYLLIGYILEKITGKSYSKSLETRIINKIGLKNTSSSIPKNKGTDEARPYKFLNSWENVVDIYFPNVVGVGDILSTPTDMVTFINALTSDKLITKKSFLQMSNFKDKDVFAMGLIKVPFYDQTGLGHNGGTYGSYSVLYAFKDSGISFASCTNGLNYSLNDISIGILSISNNKPYQIPTFKVIVFKPEELEAYTGVYSNPTFPIKITITQEGQSLFGQGSGQQPFPFEAIAKDKFKFDGAGIVIEFNKEKQGMTFTQGGQNLQFTKEKK